MAIDKVQMIEDRDAKAPALDGGVTSLEGKVDAILPQVCHEIRIAQERNEQLIRDMAGAISGMIESFGRRMENMFDDLKADIQQLRVEIHDRSRKRSRPH